MVIVIMDKLRVKNISSYCDCDGGAMQNSIIYSWASELGGGDGESESDRTKSNTNQSC